MTQAPGSPTQTGRPDSAFVRFRVSGFRNSWALEYHTLMLFSLKEALWNKSLYFSSLWLLKSPGFRIFGIQGSWCLGIQAGSWGCGFRDLGLN